MGVAEAPEVSDDLANRMSLFYANPTPMLNTLSSATSKLITKGVCLSVCTSVLCLNLHVCIASSKTYVLLLENVKSIIMSC